MDDKEDDLTFFSHSAWNKKQGSGFSILASLLLLISLSLSSKNFGAIFAARPGADSTKTWKCSKTSMLTYVLLVILYYYLLYSKLRLHQMKYTLICSIFQPLIILQVGKFHRITISCWRSWKSHLRVSAFRNTFTRAAPD